MTAAQAAPLSAAAAEPFTWPADAQGQPLKLGDMTPRQRCACWQHAGQDVREQIDARLGRVADAIWRPVAPPPPPAQPLLTPADRLVVAIMQPAFAGPREPRSAAYLVGVRALLLHRVAGTPVVCRWVAGSAERDAYYAGVAEGNALWRAHQAAPAGQPQEPQGQQP